MYELFDKAIIGGFLKHLGLQRQSSALPEAYDPVGTALTGSLLNHSS